MRASIKDEKYFENLISEYERVKKNSLEKMANGLIAPDRILPSKRFRFNANLFALIMKYSAGYDILLLRSEFEEILRSAPEIWPDDGSVAMPDYLFDYYINMLWLLTWGIFLDIKDEDFATIVAVWDRSGRKDWLIEYLISARIQGRPSAETLIFPVPYAALKTAVEAAHGGDTVRASTILKRYMEKEWYSGHKKASWYDNHKNKHDTFFGYWSFEAAAVVKIAGIDDSSFREHAYYPKDMLG